MSTAMLDQLLKLDPHTGVSLQLQLRKQIAEAIIRGKFKTQSPLPSSRKLSKQLNVARNTVVLAYAHLEDDGYLIAKERRGYFINPEVLTGRAIAQDEDSHSAAGEVVNAKPVWQRVIKTTQSKKKNISKPKDWQDYQYPFIYGQFDSKLFPIGNWRECCRDSVSDGDVRAWASDHFISDDPMLLDEIRTRILPRRGIWVDEDQIMITVGTQQGLFILAQMLLDQNSVMGFEDPGYTDIRNIATLQGATLQSLALDDHGLILSEALNQCDCVFVTPSHQSPTTVTMPMSRRKRLLELAAEQDFLIIEDDYEAETRFATAHTPALKSLDTQDRVIYTGSFSKILAPGLRLGYMVASKEIIQEATALRRLMVRHPSANNQRSVALFIARGYYDSLAAKLLKEYRYRREVMTKALEDNLPDSFTPPTGESVYKSSAGGGSSFWVTGPEYLNAQELKAIAAQRSLIIEPGDVHFHADQPPMNYFRLGYSSISADKITPGIELLADLIDQYPH